MKIIATAAFGLESITAREIKNLGYENAVTENGKVVLDGTETDIARLNMWLRTADRVLWEVASFNAETFEELFQGVKAVAWGEFMPIDAKMHVIGKSIQSTLSSVPACQSVTKKAIVEKMKQKYGTDYFEETGPVYKISVSIVKNTVSLTIDTSGEGLHKRGYRALAGEAPLKETLAAALIQLSYWKAERTLCDPLCGTGTIPIEAAMIALNRAPGLKRSFVCEQWPFFSDKIWKEIRDEAVSLYTPDKKLSIYGSDMDPKAIELSVIHAKQSGLDKYIDFKVKDVKNLYSEESYGFIITNPPYGERLGTEKQAEKLYKTMSEVFSKLDNWSYYILPAYTGFEKIFGRKADKRRKLFNGRIECQYYRFLGNSPKRKENTK